MSRPFRIVLATWFPRDPATPQGGVEAVSVNLSRALAKIPGNEVHVVTFDLGTSKPKLREWAGLTVHRLPRPPGPLLSFAKGVGRRTLQAYLRGLSPDIVHAHDTFGIMTRGLDLPRVFTIHGFIHEDTRLKGGWRNRLRAVLWEREEIATWIEQPHIISISPYVRERLRGIARGVIHDVENLIDPACFEVARHEMPSRVFSAAVIAIRKNSLGLARAVASLSPAVTVDLRLAGPVVEPAYARDLESFAADSTSAGSIHLLGNLTASQVREELASAAVFALVSFEEGAPMGIAEAMAAGVPVLTSNRCGMPYMVRHGETGFLVDPASSGDISQHLTTLLTDDSLRHRMGRAARNFALHHFHPERVAERTLGVYRGLLGRPEGESQSRNFKSTPLNPHE